MKQGIYVRSHQPTAVHAYATSPSLWLAFCTWKAPGVEPGPTPRPQGTLSKAYSVLTTTVTRLRCRYILLQLLHNLISLTLYGKAMVARIFP